MNEARSIPNALNAAIVAAQLAIVVGSILSCKWIIGWQWIAVGFVFVVTMNSVYFAIHEAEHGVLFSSRRINHFVGTILSLFMPAPYTLIRRIHLAHHVHNRSDDETFDLYFESD